MANYSFEKIEVNPGDVILFRQDLEGSGFDLSELSQIFDNVRNHFSGNEVVAIPNGISLSVVSKTQKESETENDNEFRW